MILTKRGLKVLFISSPKVYTIVHRMLSQCTKTLCIVVNMMRAKRVWLVQAFCRRCAQFLQKYGIIIDGLDMRRLTSMRRDEQMTTESEGLDLHSFRTDRPGIRKVLGDLEA